VELAPAVQGGIHPGDGSGGQAKTGPLAMGQLLGIYSLCLWGKHFKQQRGEPLIKWLQTSWFGAMQKEQDPPGQALYGW